MNLPKCKICGGLGCDTCGTKCEACNGSGIYTRPIESPANVSEKPGYTVQIDEQKGTIEQVTASETEGEKEEFKWMCADCEKHIDSETKPKRCPHCGWDGENDFMLVPYEPTELQSLHQRIAELEKSNNVYIKERDELMVKVAELDKERDHLRAELKSTQKHLADANRGAEINAHINKSQAGKINELRAELQRVREARKGIYAASKVIHAGIWREARAGGLPIISTWIDEAGPGETKDYHDLIRRCFHEATHAELVILYCEPNEVLKGALVEVGAALACGVPVYCAGTCQNLPKLCREHPLWKQFKTLDELLRAAQSALSDSSENSEVADVNQSAHTPEKEKNT